MKRALSTVEFAKLVDAAPDDESTYLHPVMADVYLKIKQVMSVRSFTAPPSVEKVISSRDHPNGVVVKLWVGSGEETRALEVKAGKAVMLGELAFYIISFKQVVPANLERAREFAFSRELVLRHGLFMDSTEKMPMTIGETLRFDAEELRLWANKVKKPEVFYACLYASAHSFLISGHHASAANLDNKLAKILGALGEQTTLEAVRNLIPTAVYHGPHPASMRLLLAYLFTRAKTEKITNAIALRLRPNPPLSAAFVNLEIYCDALNAARFFEVFGKQDEYRTFKTNMAEIRRTMWYVAPYSKYLYNKSVEDPQFEKAEAGKLAAYAAALRVALPTSSLAMSPALDKLATESNRNALAATLYVESYVLAFRRFFRFTVEQNMSRAFGVRREALRET
jgi:hypothetical protein